MRKPGTSFLARLAEAKPLIGTLISTSATEVAEALALCGFEWLFLDVEHSVLDMAAAQHILQAVSSLCYGVIRLPDNHPEHFKKALDTGCDGIIVPMVNSVADAERAVKSAKYPPLGERSVGLARAQGYGLHFNEYLQSANQAVGLIVQIEHQDAVEQVDRIVAVPGIDAIFIGPYDLSASMGLIGQTSAAPVVKAISRIRRACRSAGLPCGSYCLTADRAKDEIANGGRLIVVGSDLSFMTRDAKAALDSLPAEPPS